MFGHRHGGNRLNQLKAYFANNLQRLDGAQLFETQYPHLTAKLGLKRGGTKKLAPNDFRTPCHTPGFQWATSVGNFEEVIKQAQFANHGTEGESAMKQCIHCPRTFPRGTGLPHTGKAKAKHEHTLYWVKGHYLPRNDARRSCVLCEFKSRMDGWRAYIGSDSNSDVEELHSAPEASQASKDVDDGVHALVPTLCPVGPSYSPPFSYALTRPLSLVPYFSPALVCIAHQL